MFLHTHAVQYCGCCATDGVVLHTGYATEPLGPSIDGFLATLPCYELVAVTGCVLPYKHRKTMRMLSNLTRSYCMYITMLLEAGAVHAVITVEPSIMLTSEYVRHL